jgi:hypothetical protein
LAYDGEPRVDTAVLDQLETILRHVQEELAAWRTRALKAEADLKDHPAPARGAGPARHETEQENKNLKQRVEAARVRVGELLSRLTFLEDQARDSGTGGGNGQSRAGGSSGRAGTGSAAGAGTAGEGTA